MSPASSSCVSAARLHVGADALPALSLLPLAFLDGRFDPPCLRGVETEAARCSFA